MWTTDEPEGESGYVKNGVGWVTIGDRLVFNLSNPVRWNSPVEKWARGRGKSRHCTWQLGQSLPWLSEMVRNFIYAILNLA